jgi:Tat protein translocase TatB subunit
MFNVGPAELIVIFLVALLIVGPKRLPELGRTIGKSLREFRRVSDDFKQQLDFGAEDDDFPDEEPDGQEPKKAEPPSSETDAPA